MHPFCSISNSSSGSRILEGVLFQGKSGERGVRGSGGEAPEAESF